MFSLTRFDDTYTVMGHIRWALLGLATISVSGCLVPVTYERYTCVVCRLFRLKTTYGFVPVSRRSETECSRWYSAHVEPRHDHVWERSTCVYEGDLWGFPHSVGCSPGRYPIWMLSSETQMRVYQHFKNPLDAKALFAGLTDARTHGDRLDEHDDDKGRLIVRSLEEWDAAGFPGNWQDWWDRWFAKHTAEHKEWLEWLHSDSHTNFWDWQKQKNAGS
jgi:hypothetical protein